jgi:hypothetical protein
MVNGNGPESRPLTARAPQIPRIVQTTAADHSTGNPQTSTADQNRLSPATKQQQRYEICDPRPDAAAFLSA